MEQKHYNFHKKRKSNIDKKDKFENCLFRNNSAKDYNFGISQNTFSKNKDNSENLN